MCVGWGGVSGRACCLHACAFVLACVFVFVCVRACVSAYFHIYVYILQSVRVWVWGMSAGMRVYVK